MTTPPEIAPPVSRAAVIAAARAWLGVPWRHQGRTRARGIDCVGLVVLVGEAAGSAIEDATDYRRTPSDRALQAALDARLARRRLPVHVPGAVLLFRSSPFPTHIAIAAEKDGRPTLIHARRIGAGAGAVMEEPYTHDWPKTLIAAWDYPGVE
jgi:cell wall-associated NlpC family hydrolase